MYHLILEFDQSHITNFKSSIFIIHTAKSVKRCKNKVKENSKHLINWRLHDSTGWADGSNEAWKTINGLESAIGGKSYIWGGHLY